MKFNYAYRTPDNEQHRGVIRASSRDAAYAALKAQGIKPSHVDEAPGFFNKLFGKGKRWIAIAILGFAAVVFGLVAYRLHCGVEIAQQESLFDDRAQLYGDPVVIGECERTGWTNVFHSAFDCFLATYAIPGKEVTSVARVEAQSFDPAPVAVLETDLAEVKQMKRMVNGMKRELSAYVKAGGTLEMYVRRLRIRQMAERNIFITARRQMLSSDDVIVWHAKNAELRARGLPMVSMEDENRPAFPKGQNSPLTGNRKF